MRFVDPVQLGGALPDESSKRTVSFFVIFTCCFTKILGFALGVALLFISNGYLAGVLVLAGHVSLVWFVKAFQKSFFCHVPFHGRLREFIGSSCLSLSQTMISQTTFMISFAHPYCLGQRLWMTCVGFPWVLLFTTIYLIKDELSFRDEQVNPILKDSAGLWITASLLLLVFCLSFACMLSLCTRECRLALLQNETGPQFVQRFSWRRSQRDDKERALLLTNLHHSYLQLFAGEARQWLSDNWQAWEAQPPAWFNQRWKRGLPDCVLSSEVRKALGGKKRRRSILAEQLGAAADHATPAVSM